MGRGKKSTNQRYFKRHIKVPEFKETKKEIIPEFKETKKEIISDFKKSENEIISELKKKKKYSEWKNLGGYFGLISNTLKEKFFLVRPYKYYDMDNKIVSVSMIQKNYRPGVKNIPVFKQIIEHNPNFVKQGKYKIVDNNEKLTTSGLFTCTALAIQFGDKKFLSHLDALTNTSNIIESLNKHLINIDIDRKNIYPIIYTGMIMNHHSLDKAKHICSSLNIPKENCMEEIVSLFDDVSI